jgi:hypothetical protein
MILIKEAANVWSASGDLDYSPQLTQSMSAPAPGDGNDGDFALEETP